MDAVIVPDHINMPLRYTTMSGMSVEKIQHFLAIFVNIKRKGSIVLKIT